MVDPEKLRKLRAVRGFSQGDLSKRSGVSVDTLVDWEAGRAKRPRYSNLLAVAKALKVQPEELAVAPDLPDLVRAGVSDLPRPGDDRNWQEFLMNDARSLDDRSRMVVLAFTRVMADCGNIEAAYRAARAWQAMAKVIVELADQKDRKTNVKDK